MGTLQSRDGECLGDCARQAGGLLQGSRGRYLLVNNGAHDGVGVLHLIAVDSESGDAPARCFDDTSVTGGGHGQLGRGAVHRLERAGVHLSDSKGVELGVVVIKCLIVTVVGEIHRL